MHVFSMPSEPTDKAVKDRFAVRQTVSIVDNGVIVFC